ncbi:hypothetical protein SCUP515_08049 [Seiridium cupressi]
MQPKGKLPFKKRKSTETSAQKDKPNDADHISFFGMQDPNWFDKRIQNQASEEAKREKAKKERIVQQDQDIKDQLSRESSEIRITSQNKQRNAKRPGPKRQYTSISSDEDHPHGSTSPISRKSSRIDTKSPSRSRDSARRKSTPLSSRSYRLKGSLPPAAVVISLDNSDEDPYTGTPTKSRGTGKITVLSDDDDGDFTTSAPAQHDIDSDDVVEMDNDSVLPAADDVGAIYIREAQERARKRREEQEAREAHGIATAEIFVESRLEGISNLKIKVEINKKLTLVRDAWRAATKRKLEGSNSNISGAIIDSMFFTWKGTKLLDFSTLERMNITPDKQGNLYPKSRNTVEGYIGWDKVHFEAWTPEQFDQHQASRERERRRNLGEPDDIDVQMDTHPEPEVDKKIKIFFRSKNYEEQKRSVHPNDTIDKLMKGFRKAANLPADKVIEIHFEGDNLPPAMKIEDLGLEDKDVLEVHVKDS